MTDYVKLIARHNVSVLPILIIFFLLATKVALLNTLYFIMCQFNLFMTVTVSLLNIINITNLIFWVWQLQLPTKIYMAKILNDEQKIVIDL